MAIIPAASQTRLIENYEQIDDLEEINGIPIAQIEASFKAQGSKFHLAEEEKLKDVVKADWKTVEALGTTHKELAEILKKIWKTMQHQSPDEDEFYDASQIQFESPNLVADINQTCLKITYITTTLGILGAIASIVAAAVISPFALLGLIPAGMLLYFRSSENQNNQLLSVNITFVNRHHDDIFHTKRLPDGAPIHFMELKNQAIGETIKIEKSTISTIQNYGFYQGGGDQNEFRVDPKKLVSILLGRRV